MAEGTEEVKATFQIAYEGDSSGHSMDVGLLAPALMGMGDLIRETNARLNGQRSTVRVLVQSDFEHKCFLVDLEVVQTIMQHVRTLLDSAEVKTAKDLLDFLGITPAAVVAAPLTVLGYLKLKRGRRVKKSPTLKDVDQRGMVKIEFGDGASVETVTVHNHVYQIAENPVVKQAVMDTLTPVGTDGFDRVDFRQGDLVTATIDKGDVENILLSCNDNDEQDEPTGKPQEIVAHLKNLSPVFVADAERWRFMYDGKPISADISETEIAKRAVERGVAGANDLYKVRLEITEHKTKTGRFRFHYKVKEVLDFIPAPVQGDLLA